MPTPRKVVITFISGAPEHLLQGVQVVLVWVREPQPSHVRGVDDGLELAHEGVTVHVETGIDQDGLARLDEVRVHGQDAKPGMGKYEGRMSISW
jgi:hypothetical protein